MLIKVTEKHIKDARKGTLYTREQNCNCPISLALFEQFYGGSYQVKYRGHFRRKNYEIRFYQPKEYRKSLKWTSNPFSVASTIRVNHVFNNKWYFNHDINLTTQLKKFIIEFDKGMKVVPFEFDFELE